MEIIDSKRLSRRQWLAGAAAFAAAAMVPARQAMAQAGAARPYRIDTHHHYYPAKLYPGRDWTPSRSIDAMGHASIATAILSRPGIPVSEPEKARKLARETNEYVTQVARDHPGRFGVFATLPLFDRRLEAGPSWGGEVDGTLREIAHNFDVLKADGVCLVTSYGNRWPGDPAFAPIFDELNRRRAVVFIHPAAPAYYNSDFTLKLQPAALEFMFDTARAIVSLILNGTLYRCPDIRFIFAHGGGALPFLHERLDHLVGGELPTRSDGGYRSEYLPHGIGIELKKLYFDIVRVANPASFALLTELMAPERLLFGTDYSAVSISETASHLPGLHLDGKVLRGIERDNALALFPRFKA